MRSSTALSFLASLSSVSAAAYQGFNYGSTNGDGSGVTVAQFTTFFNDAKSLAGTNGAFSAARLYTTIQGGSSTNQPIEAITAAINTNTKLLLGVWASGGQAGISAEIIALKSAMSTLGLTAANVVGLSVGSEDLYRISPTGIAAKSGYGANPDELVNYIAQIRAAIVGTPLSGVPIGHVDTWTAWVNGSNSAVIDAVDWLGVDAYPYFQNTQSNGIENGAGLFNDAYTATEAVAKGKSVWITETGWPLSGPTQNLAIPSVANAKTYWDQVGCPRFGNVNTFWYTLYDGASTATSPSFGIVGPTLGNTPAFDLSCAAVASSSAAASPSTSSPAASSSAPAPSSSAVASSSAPAVSSSSAPVLVSSGGGLSPSQSPPIVSSVQTTSHVVTTTAASSIVSTGVVATTITTVVGAGNGTATTATPPTSTAATTTTHTGAAMVASGPAAGGLFGLALAFLAALY